MLLITYICHSVVFFPAIGNHPLDCWTEGGVSSDTFWPLDNLTKVAPKARVMLYGYNPEGLEEATSGINDRAETFLRRFQRLRRLDGREVRPIIYVAHSTGCLVAKRVLCQSIDDVENDLVKSVIFLGAPHDGLDHPALKAATSLELSRDLMDELGPGSPAVLELNADFAPIADQLHIVACYEKRETMFDDSFSDFIVPQDTATLFSSTSIDIDADHIRLAQAQKKEVGTFDEIVGSIKDAVNKVTKPAGWRANSFSANGFGAASPGSDRLQDEDPSLKSNSLSPPKMTGLERFQTAASEYQSRGMSLSFPALRNRKKSVPVNMQRQNSVGIPEDRSGYLLFNALRSHDFQTAHKLVETFTDFDLKDPHNDDRTALHEAAIAGDMEVCRALLEAGAMPEPRTSQSFQTPLHFAALHGHDKVIRLLLEHGGKIDSKAADDTTPLHNAAERGHRGAIIVLVEKGANVNTLAGNKTPFDKSRDKGYFEITKFLYAKGSRPYKAKPSKGSESNAT